MASFARGSIYIVGTVNDTELRTKGKQVFVNRNKIESERDYEYKYTDPSTQVRVVPLFC
jgi:hypothetical protein